MILQTGSLTLLFMGQCNPTTLFMQMLGSLILLFVGQCNPTTLFVQVLMFLQTGSLTLLFMGQCNPLHSVCADVDVPPDGQPHPPLFGTV